MSLCLAESLLFKAAMHIPSALSSVALRANPNESTTAGGVPPPDGGVAQPAAPNTPRCDNTLDSFDGGPPRSLLPPVPPQPDAGSPSVSVATLMTQGPAALNVMSKKGPPVVTEPITTETSAAQAPKDWSTVQLEVPWYSQHVDHGAVKGGPKSCNPMVKEMMKDSKAHVVPRGSDEASNFNIADSKDALGRINPNPARAAEALAYIDGQLEAQRPVMVGVAWRTPSPGGNGGNADHYVVVTGRGVDEQGRRFYTFHDPGSKGVEKGGDSCPTNRFYVDEKTNMLFRAGLQRAVMYSSDARYEVSQVRKNQ